MSHLSYLEAIVVGAFQGVTELFPVSSLGHSVLVPAVVGGSWGRDLNVSAPESSYLAFIVGLHVATALALLVFFWRDWVAIVRGLLTSVVHRRIEEPHERLAWLIVIATIPVGISGLALEHLFRTTLGRPVPSAVFLTVNGAVLWGAELLRRRPRSVARSSVARPGPVPSPVGRGSRASQVSGESRRSATADAGVLTMGDVASSANGAVADVRLSALGVGRATLIGSSQVLALLPGISRSGVTMAAGLLRGLDHEDAARFSFLLATPVILAAGVLKLPDLFGPLGARIHGQVLAGSVASFISAYVAVRFLTRWFHTRTLTPFAIYCLLAGAASLLWLTLGS